MREIKFRAWFDISKQMEYYSNYQLMEQGNELMFSANKYFRKTEGEEIKLMQFTGLTDKNGKEIWELCELDGRYIVIYKAPKFCLYDILKGDIIEFNDKDKHEITTEYKQLPQDAEGSID